MKRFLQVVPNPFCALDVHGRAQGVVELEGIAGQYVGAVEDPELSRAEGKHVFRFLPGTARVPLSAYYLRRLRDGELLPVDEPTARVAGLPFVDPETALRNARDRAIAQFTATNGSEPACAAPLATT